MVILGKSPVTGDVQRIAGCQCDECIFNKHVKMPSPCPVLCVFPLQIPSTSNIIFDLSKFILKVYFHDQSAP